MLLVLCVFSSTVELHYTRFTQNIHMISSLRMNSLIEAIMINYQFEPNLKLIWMKHFDKKKTIAFIEQAIHLEILYI